MDRITLENYRCFREKQSARLAPLTLLVGNNSTGKTSFLALIRALWDVAFPNLVPNFREEPFDLGSFRDIVHDRGRRGDNLDSFEAGFKLVKGICFNITFRELHGAPFPTTRVIGWKSLQFEAQRQDDGVFLTRYTTPLFKSERVVNEKPFLYDGGLTLMRMMTEHFTELVELSSPDKSDHSDTNTKDKVFAHKDTLRELNEVDSAISTIFEEGIVSQSRPFAGAPIRSRPRRTYDPTQPSRDPEGEYIPTYIANLSHRDKKGWGHLKGNLEAFGRESGLFDEFYIKLLDKAEGSPFQVQVRKFGRRLKGGKRNLIDVGYGISQALPLLTELLRKDAPSMFLLQQPEVHLHPSAQAALGSLFCNIAGPDRQLILETHSNYILDRVRMDIRDRKTDLNPEDVSILFFESGELDVTIHSLRLDENGNVLDAPPGYGQFFVDETRRSIGI